jgi:hypothetical protein
MISESGQDLGEVCKHEEDQFSTYDVTNKGYIVNQKGKAIRNVLKWLNGEIKDEAKTADLDYGGLGCSRDGNTPWPLNYQWIACFSVTGGNEGHYIHVEIIYGNGKREILFLGKTFCGMEHALQVANACSRLLS